jgi:hypothetical protein
MRDFKIEFDEPLLAEVTKHLRLLNRAYVTDKNILAIARTPHHETGQPVYSLGYHPLSKCPPDTLVRSGEMVVGLFVEPSEMEEFNGTKLYLRDGYIELG